MGTVGEGLRTRQGSQGWTFSRVAVPVMSITQSEITFIFELKRNLLIGLAKLSLSQSSQEKNFILKIGQDHNHSLIVVLASSSLSNRVTPHYLYLRNHTIESPPHL